MGWFMFWWYGVHFYTNQKRNVLEYELKSIKYTLRLLFYKIK